MVVDVPSGAGKVVGAIWCLDDSKQFTRSVDMDEAVVSADASRIEFETKVSYDKPGTYFPTVLVYSERFGNPDTNYTRIANLDKVRIVVN